MIETLIMPWLWSKKLFKELVRPGPSETLDRQGQKSESFYGGEKMEGLMGKIKERLDQAGRSIKVAGTPDGPFWACELHLCQQTLLAAYNMLVDLVRLQKLESQAKNDADKAPDPLPLPRWKCHKVVEAFKIGEIYRGHSTCGVRLNGVGGEHVEVDNAFTAHHNPQNGGYYVRYEDGYESYSPAEAFEGGYTRMSDEALFRYQGDGYFGEDAQGGRPLIFPKISRLGPEVDGTATEGIVHRDKINKLIDAINEMRGGWHG